MLRGVGRSWNGSSIVVAGQKSGHKRCATGVDVRLKTCDRPSYISVLSVEKNEHHCSLPHRRCPQNNAISVLIGAILHSCIFTRPFFQVVSLAPLALSL